jgi:MFS family permease
MSDSDLVEYAPTCCGRLKRTFYYEPAKPLHKNELKSRWVTMLLLCMGLASSYYAFDIPSATETALQSAFLGSGTGPSDTCVNGTNIPAGDSAAADQFNNNFNLLYSVYAWPNVALPFFGGFLADRMGVRL